MFKLIVFQGPSGSGKSALQTELMIPKVISWTSRLPRKDEINGEDYHFTSEENLDNMNVNGELLEVSKYGENLYATSIESVTNIRNTPHSIIVDVFGTRSLRRYLGESLLVIGVYAELEDCKKRLMARGSSKELIRLEAYHGECEHLKECDIVINNSISFEIESRKVIKLMRYGLKEGNVKGDPQIFT